MLLILGSAAGAVLAVVAVIKLIIPACKAVYHFLSDVAAFFYVWGGRGPSVDPVTGEPQEPVDPLPVVLGNVRKELKALDGKVADQGQVLSDLTSVVQTLADQQGQLAQQGADIVSLKAGHADLDGRVEVVEASVSGIIATTFKHGSDAALEAERLKQGDPAIDGEAVE